MSAEGRTEGVTYLHSNLSLPRPLLYMGGIAAHEKYMQQTGADGMEVTPLPASNFMRQVLRRAEMIQTISAGLGCIEERSYFMLEHGYDERKEWGTTDEAITQLIRARHSPFRLDGQKAGLIGRQFSPLTKGLGELGMLQAITGSTPLVLYAGMPDKYAPNGLLRYNARNAGASRRTHQPKHHEWQKLGIHEHSSIETIVGTLGAYGIEGVTFDVFHAKTFHDPVGLAHKLASAGLVDGIHLAVNRTDMTPRNTLEGRATSHAAWAFAKSAKAASYTPEGAMMQAIACEWNTNELYAGMPRRVVLEEGPYGLHTARSQAAMLDTAREILEG